MAYSAQSFDPLNDFFVCLFDDWRLCKVPSWDVVPLIEGSAKRYYCQVCVTLAKFAETGSQFMLLGKRNSFEASVAAT